MDRRSVLGLVSTALGVGLAGCNGEQEESRFEGAPGGASGDVGDVDGGGQRPAHEVLRIDGWVGYVDDSGTWRIRARVRNTADHAVSAEFVGEVRLQDGSRLVSERASRTVDGNGRRLLTLDLAEEGDLSYGERTGLVFEGFELRVLVDGQPEPGICASTDLTEPAERGCTYRAPNATFVTVEYAGDWEGSLKVDEDSVAIDRAEDGAPDGYATSYLDVDDDAEFVTVNLGKADGGDGELTVAVHHDGEVVATDSATAPDESAFVSATF